MPRLGAGSPQQIGVLRTPSWGVCCPCTSSVLPDVVCTRLRGIGVLSDTLSLRCLVCGCLGSGPVRPKKSVSCGHLRGVCGVRAHPPSCRTSYVHGYEEIGVLRTPSLLAPLCAALCAVGAGVALPRALARVCGCDASAGGAGHRFVGEYRAAEGSGCRCIGIY